MKKYKINPVMLLVLFALTIISCNNETVTVDAKSKVKTKTQKTVDAIFKTGDFINGKVSPNLISSEDVYNLKGGNLIIDLRKAKDYADGHIKNSVNLKIKELIDYAQAKGIPQYEKVILVCYTGQSASFSAAIMNALGYSNIYVMKWGMCSWNSKFSSRWPDNVSDKGLSKTVNKSIPKNDSISQPIIEHDKYSGQEIIYARSRVIMNEGFGSIAVKLNYAEAYAKKSYIVSYTPENVYKQIHLKNSVHYSPDSSLNISTDLLTLPADKTIIIYSNDGHQSAYIAAFLKILAYDAKTLKYGANSFINSKMLKFGYGFNKNQIKNYPFETSVYIEVEEEVQEGGC